MTNLVFHVTYRMDSQQESQQALPHHPQRSQQRSFRMLGFQRSV